MKNKGSYYCGYFNGKRICMSYIFSPHFFSTSVMIEVFVSEGKKCECYKIEQELSPQSGIKAYPDFTYSSFDNGKTRLFYSNSFLLETALVNGMDIHIYKAMKKYESNVLRGLEGITSRFTKPNITRFLCGIEDSEVTPYPTVELETYRGKKGHCYILSVFGDYRIYEDIERLYKYNPQEFYALIPFFEYDYIDETQYLEELDNLSPDDWNNLWLSIIQNKQAIECFEDIINYVNNSSANDFINTYFKELIECVKSFQDNQIVNEKACGKVLINCVPKLNK